MNSVLKIDIDKEIDFKQFKKKLKDTLEFFRLKHEKIEVFDTKHGHHICINLSKEIDNASIVFLQLLLGSDPNREMFNWLRIKHLERTRELRNFKHWNVLFAKKWVNKKLISKEVFNKKITNYMNR